MPPPHSGPIRQPQLFARIRRQDLRYTQTKPRHRSHGPKGDTPDPHYADTSYSIFSVPCTSQNIVPITRPKHLDNPGSQPHETSSSQFLSGDDRMRDLHPTPRTPAPNHLPSPKQATFGTCTPYHSCATAVTPTATDFNSVRAREGNQVTILSMGPLMVSVSLSS